MFGFRRRREKPPAPPRGKECHCSFCNKSQRAVKKLIAGPNVYICDECVEICNQIVAEDRKDDSGPPRVVAVLCGLCRLPFDAATALLIENGRGPLCPQCVAEIEASLAERRGVMNRNFLLHASFLVYQTEGMRFARFDEVYIIDSGLPCDTFNIVTGSTPEVGRVIEQFNGRPFSWWCPAPNEHLRDCGFEPAESELEMSLDLEDFAQTSSPFRIERVRTPDELAHFARINAANWTPPDENVIRFYERTAHAALRTDSPLRYYLGYVDDTPVAAGELTIAADEAGLYNISTLQAHRRKGLGTAMTSHLLNEARRDGARTAILQAAPKGTGIYRRLGFRECGTIIEYKLTTPPASSPPSN